MSGLLDARDGTDDSSAYVAAAIRRARVVDDVGENVATLPVARIGIIGAGTMGGGIAMNFANVGLDVRLVETRADALERGLAAIRANYGRSVNRSRLSAAEAEERLAHISGGLDIAELADCDLIIEAVFEDMDLKKAIFRQLDAIARAGAILATNTSGLDVDAIAAATRRPESVIGLHFFSPANVMKLLEVVRGEKTSTAVIATAMSLAAEIGKIAVLVGVCPGFVGNRMLYPRQFRALSLLARGVTPWNVDRVIKEFGFKMGPFEMSDLAGLDIGWKPGATTLNPVRDALCEIGRRGQKTGAGYYDYDADRIPRPSEVTAALIAERLGVDPSAGPVSDREILEECLFPLVNEGARILGEGKAQRPSDIDVVWLFGYGWPQHTGGPMRWADEVGLDRIRDKVAAIAASDPAYSPAPLLEQLVGRNGKFADL